MKIVYIIFFSVVLHAQKGVVLKPIIDLVGHPIASNTISYHSLPSAGGSQQPFDACPRTHQLLYNETVEIIKQTDDEICVKLNHLFYVTTENRTPQATFWTHKENVTPFSQLSKQMQMRIPEPYNYQSESSTQPITVILTKPWHSKTLKTTFSIGTRFVPSSENQTRGCFAVWAICPKTLQPITLLIPQSHAMIIEDANKEAARERFVKLLQSWARMSGTIPYIWGGCSVTETLRTGRFKHISITCNNRTCDAYQQTEMKRQPQSGFDCTGLILRAAQAAGLPYYYKNSTTIAQYLNPITSRERIKEGDLIWIPGHIMAISNLKKNTIIEARHYNDGFGRVHEIRLNHLFKNIETFADLYHTIAHNQPLYRLNRGGRVSKTVSQAKILSIDSCWDR